jgi:hypothetical protein
MRPACVPCFYPPCRDQRTSAFVERYLMVMNNAWSQRPADRWTAAQMRAVCERVCICVMEHTHIYIYIYIYIFIQSHTHTITHTQSPFYSPRHADLSRRLLTTQLTCMQCLDVPAVSLTSPNLFRSDPNPLPHVSVRHHFPDAVELHVPFDRSATAAAATLAAAHDPAVPAGTHAPIAVASHAHALSAPASQVNAPVPADTRPAAASDDPAVALMGDTGRRPLYGATSNLVRRINEYSSLPSAPRATNARLPGLSLMDTRSQTHQAHQLRSFTDDQLDEDMESQQKSPLLGGRLRRR